MYKAHLFDDQGVPIDVAVKTLKGLKFLTKKTVTACICVSL